MQPSRRQAWGLHPEQAARKADEQQEQARPHSQVHLHLPNKLSLLVARACALVRGFIGAGHRQVGCVPFFGAIVEMWHMTSKTRAITRPLL